MASAPIRVLLVEDCARGMSPTFGQLMQVGPRLYLNFCPTLAEAIHRLDTESFDVVLLGMFLPDSQGLDTVQAVLPHAGTIPVIALANQDTGHMLPAAEAAGAVAGAISGEFWPDQALTRIQEAMAHTEAGNAAAPAAEQEALTEDSPGDADGDPTPSATEPTAEPDPGLAVAPAAAEEPEPELEPTPPPTLSLSPSPQADLEAPSVAGDEESPAGEGSGDAEAEGDDGEPDEAEAVEEDPVEAVYGPRSGGGAEPPLAVSSMEIPSAAEALRLQDQEATDLSDGEGADDWPPAKDKLYRSSFDTAHPDSDTRIIPLALQDPDGVDRVSRDTSADVKKSVEEAFHGRSSASMARDLAFEGARTERIEALEALVETLQARLAEVEARPVTARPSEEEQAARRQEAESLATVEKGVAAIDGRLASLEARVAERVQERFVELDRRVNHLELQQEDPLEEVELEVVSLEEAVRKSKPLEALERRLAEVESVLDVAKGYGKRLSVFEVHLNQALARLQGLEQGLAKAGDGATLTEEIRALRAALRRFEGQVADEVRVLWDRLRQEGAALDATRRSTAAAASPAAATPATSHATPSVSAPARQRFELVDEAGDRTTAGGGFDMSETMTATELAAALRTQVETTVEDATRRGAILAQMDQEPPAFWEAALQIGAYYNDAPVSPETRVACRAMIDGIRAFQGRKAATSTETTTVVFGTSGWRGVIGEDFTVLNVHKVARGIIEMMRTDAFLKTNGYASFDEVKLHGILVFRDNRFMGDEFMAAAAAELAAEGIKIHLAGECPTGVGSALVTELDAAGSINFTPSHNPMDYAGIKFNPADGGPADTDLTALIEEKANAYMAPGASFTPADADASAWTTAVDAKAIFANFVETRGKVFDVAAIRRWLLANKADLCLVVDFMHGSSRGYVEAVLGAEVVTALTEAGALSLVNTDTDYSFHGVKPEPSAKNQAPLVKACKVAGKRYSLAVALDPDADRIRFADAKADIDMNRFGAIAFAAVLGAGLEGGVATTAPSSDFALEIAKQEKRPIFETAVGFKFFREPLKGGTVLVAFEESDGISFLGHTLEKCALAGFLMALQTMVNTGENISTQYDALRAKYGYFYPAKAGADVKGVSVEAWQAYKKAVVDVLTGSLYKVGDTVTIAGEAKAVAEINTIDGLKLIFQDKSWILLRPSGTEPKFRYYYELASEVPLEGIEARMKAYEEAASEILTQARARVDGQ